MKQFTEKQIQRQIEDFLQLSGYLYTVSDAGDNRGKSKVKTGWPDITAVIPDKKGTTGHIVAAIECKTATGHLRPEQVETLARFKALGAIVIVARSVEDVVQVLRGI